MVSLKKNIAWFLIGLLSIEMIFRVPFSLPGVQALESQSHENIVSLIVEEGLFRKMSSDIDVYARRIQSQLPNTRTVILTFPEKTSPYLIASANERLYFSGIPNHGSKTQKLVGTILVGHIPLPVVHKDDTYFLSLYPYIDFQEPHFYWDKETSQFEYLDAKRKDERSDIWHSVIDPNTGNLDTDVKQIRDFFARVYEFDQKKDRYQDLGKDPQVLYMDTVNESRATSPGLLAVYEKIFLPMQEHLLYNRFTKKFAQYIYTNYESLVDAEGSKDIPSFFDWKEDTKTSTPINTEGDIGSKDVIDTYAIPFVKAINEKYLGDVRRWVHNTGRYYNGYSDVRVDLIPEFILQKDSLTGEILQGGNDVLEKLIDSYVDTYVSLDIPILVRRDIQKTLPNNGAYDFTYDNYFFGLKASDITSARQCSLIRGSDFGGRNATAEMNHGYNVDGGKSDSNVINIDEKAGINCTDKTNTYWGGNSSLDLLYINNQFTLEGNRYDDFIRPVLDLSSGKQVSQKNSPLNCLRNDLILRPYKYTGQNGASYVWPTETGGTRYSCATSLRSTTPTPFSLDPTPEVDENILTSLTSCSAESGTINLLDRKGVSLGLCQAPGLSGVYKRISSLVKHTDPTKEVYEKQLKSTSSPNIPVDENRYLLFLNRSGKEERIDYPNLFDISVRTGDSDEAITQKIRDVLGTVQSRLISSPLPSDHKWAKLAQSSTNVPISLADVLLNDVEVRTTLIEALRWRSLNTVAKYAHVFDLSLLPKNAGSNLLLPDKKDLYEISYLGGLGDAKNFVFAFFPQDTSVLPKWFSDVQSVHNSSTSSQPYSSLSGSSSGQSGYGFSFGGIGLGLGGLGSGIGSLGGGGAGGIGGLGGSGGGLEDIWKKQVKEDQYDDIENEEYEDTFVGEEDKTAQPHKSELSPKTKTESSSGGGEFPWNDKITAWLEAVKQIGKDTSDWYTPKDIKHDFPELPSYSLESDTSGLSANTLTSGLASTTSPALLSSVLNSSQGTVNLLSSILDSSGISQEGRDISQADLNTNGITDFVEDNASALTLTISSSESAIKPLGSTTVYTALSDGSSILRDSASDIVLTVLRIDDFDTNTSYTPNSANWSRIQKEYYTISGSNSLQNGQAQWTLSSKKDHWIRITYEAQINKGSDTILHSKKATLLVGGNTLDIAIHPVHASASSGNYIAGNSEGIDILLDGIDSFPSTADVVIRDYVTKRTLWTYTSIPISQKKIHLSDVLAKDLLHQSGKYTVTVIVSGYSGTSHFVIDSDVVHHIDIGLPNTLLKDTSYALGISLKDVSGNTVSLDDWNIKIESNTNVILSPLASGSTKSASGKIPSALTFIPLESGNTKLKLTMTRGSETISGEFSRSVISDAHIVVNVSNRDSIQVGQDIPVTFLIQRSDGTLVEDWDIPVKVAIRGGNAKLSASTLAFSKGKATATLSTGSKMGEIIFYLPETGLGKTLNDVITVHSGLPAVLSLQTSEFLYAKQGLGETVKYFLYDSYGNLTSLQGYTIHTESDDPSLLQGTIVPKEITTGIYEAKIESSGLPGRILLHTWLEKDGKKTPIKTLENAVKILALPVITSEEASRNSWQNITQVLLGAPFGQTPIRGYFAGSTLFSPSTKTLSLSTLVDVPEEPIFTLSPSGNILLSSSDVVSDVGVLFDSYKDGKLSLFVYDGSGTIARVRYPSLNSQARLTACSDCDEDMQYFIPNASGVTYANGDISRYGQKLFRISEIFSYPGLSYSFKRQNGDALQLGISYGSIELGTYVLRWKLKAPQDIGLHDASAIQIELMRSTFATQPAWYGSSSNETPGLVVYSSGASVKSPGGSNGYGWSQYPGNPGLGWTYENTSLLQFASGQEWSSALQNNVDYTTINIGDPIIKLPEYRVNDVTGFDHTIGKPVYFGSSDISDFSFRDANSDGKKDLIVFHEDGTIGMGISQGNGEIYNAGDLLSLHLAEKDMIRTGDFVGDGYADVVYVDGGGILHLVDHSESGPVEKPISYDTFPLLGKIQQLEVFDMDHDGRDDIIVLDHLGSLFIFYGQESGTFRVQLIEKVYDFVLSPEAKASYFTGGVRYRGTGFTDPGSIPLSSSSETKTKQEEIHKTLFTKVTFSSQKSANSSGNVGGLVQTNNGGTVSVTNSLQFGYSSTNSGTPSSSDSQDTNLNTAYFLNAPFVNPKYLSITKQYQSLDASGQLLPNSQIEVTLSLKNTSNKPIQDVMVFERFADYLSVSGNTYDMVYKDKRVTKQFIDHDARSKIIDIRGDTIGAGETLNLVYRGTLREFSFGKFDVGYLEDAEDVTSTKNVPKEQIHSIHPIASTLENIPESQFYGHDVYGDIRFNPNSTCNGVLLFWRSHNTYDRTYQKFIYDLSTGTSSTSISTSQSGSVTSINSPSSNTASSSGNSSSNSGGSNSSNILSALTGLSFLSSINSYTSGISSLLSMNANDMQNYGQSQLSNAISSSGTGDAIESATDTINDAQNLDVGDVEDALFDAGDDLANATQTKLNEKGLNKKANDISRKTKDYLADVSCGFGQSGCQDAVASNTTINVPGNPVPKNGYENPSYQAPAFCFNNVLCGFPKFAKPTRCPIDDPVKSRRCKNECYYTEGMRYKYADGAGGIFDFIPSESLSGCQDTRKGPKQSKPSGGNGIYDGYDQDYLEKGGELWDTDYLAPEDDKDNNYIKLKRKGVGDVKEPKKADMFIQGKGISDERVFIGTTLTGYTVELSCTGPNTIANGEINKPGQYPVSGPDGNCTFTLQPRAQCKDDGSEEDPKARKLNIGDSLPEKDNKIQEKNNTNNNSDSSSEDTNSSGESSSGNNSTGNNSGGSGSSGSSSSSGGSGNLDDVGSLLGSAGSLLGNSGSGSSSSGSTSGSVSSSSKKNTSIKSQGNQFSYTEDCLYFEPVTSYPTSLSQLATDYISNPNNSSVDTLNLEISSLSLVLNTIGLSDTALGISSSLLGSEAGSGIGSGIGNILGSGNNTASSSGNGGNIGPGLGGNNANNLENSTTGAGPVLTLNPDTMKFDNFGEVQNVDLVSVVGFPNYIMDWYQKWMDEIMSSLTHLPDLTILFPDVSGLADQGWLQDRSRDSNNQNSSVLDSQDRASPLNIQVTTDMQNAFEYLDSLPMVNFYPVTIQYSIPFTDPQQVKAWIAKHQAIIKSWKEARTHTSTKDIDVDGIITSVEKNIKIAETYLKLPEKLQNIYYQKENLLYGVLENVNRTQNLMGSWLKENDENYKAWIQAYEKIQKNLKNWQPLIDDFNNYEVRCAQCINERWDMKHWLHIILNPSFLPETKINQMPRWPDIVLDFSKIDLSLDIAFPVFELEFYPITLPDAPVPGVSLTSVGPMSEFPKLPDIDLKYDYPNIELPKLPALPPPPEIPQQIFSDLQTAMEKFNKLMLKMCDYRKSNKAPEWYAGAKIAEWFDYQRRGYVPSYDFSDYRYPYDFRHWIESYTVTPEFTLEYDISEFIKKVRDEFDKFDNFPKNLSNYDASSASSSTGAQTNTHTHPSGKLVAMKNLSSVREVVQKDIRQDLDVIHDLGSWQKGNKKPEEIAAIGKKIPNSLHLAGYTGEENKTLAFLDTLEPISAIPSQLTSLSANAIAVAPTPEIVTSPETTESFTNTAQKKGSEEGGLYVANGSTTHKLLDYTDNLDSHVRIHSFDDDYDGDVDLFYSVDNIIYKKSNYSKSPSLYHIKDAPKLYMTNDVYEDFFGDETHSLFDIVSSGQIHPLQNHSYENIRYQFFSKNKDDHISFQLAKSAFASRPEDMTYLIDMVSEESGIDKVSPTISDVPQILDIDGLTYIQHNTIDAKLLSGGKYVGISGKIQDMPTDFVIEEGDSWYATELTQIEITNGGKTTKYTLQTGQKIIFSSESQILVKRGTLVHFSHTTEKRPLTIRDTHLPLLPGDSIITDANGSVTVGFPDKNTREIRPSQHWILTEYASGTGIKKGTFPIGEGWYYGSFTNPSYTEKGLQFPFSTVFDAYSNVLSNTSGDVPSSISLSFGTTTEIDFQKYFDSGVITKVEVPNLSESSWRRVSSTTLAFSPTVDKQAVTLRVTFASGSTKEYATTFTTMLPELDITSIDTQGQISGTTTSKKSTYPMGIQGFFDGRIWTLAQGFTVKSDGTFATSLDVKNSKISASFENMPLVTFERTSGIPYSTSSATLVPSISSGKYLGYVIKSVNPPDGRAGQERLRAEYRGKDISYRQIAQASDIQGKGIYVLGSGLRLEPATVGDKSLQGGVYITDASYRPLVTLDTSGIVRTLDENISWTVKFENSLVTFTLSKNQSELGKIIIKGDMITSWDSK